VAAVALAMVVAIIDVEVVAMAAAGVVAEATVRSATNATNTVITLVCVTRRTRDVIVATEPVTFHVIAFSQLTSQAVTTVTKPVI